jgi:hypothetical protein
MSEIGGAKPGRTVLLVGLSGDPHAFGGAIDGAAGDQRFLRIPAVEGHAELLQILADLVELALQGELVNGLESRRAEHVPRPADEGIDVRFLVAALVLVGGKTVRHAAGVTSIPVGVSCEQLPGHGVHVVALITIGRKRHVLAARLQITQPDADGEYVHGL